MQQTDTPDTVEIRPAPPGVEWNARIAASPHGTVFHREECLAAVADHTDADLHRLVGYRGGRPVGVLPVFEYSKGPATAAFSPPPGMGLPNLGPALVAHDGPPGGSVGDRFVAACWQWIRDELHPGYVHVRTADGFTDLDPLHCRDGVDVTPQFTYVLDLTPDRDALLRSFSSDARSNVRDADDRIRVREAGPDAIDRVVAQLETRYAEQGMTYPVDAAFARDLYRRLPDGWVRPYEVTVDGDYAGGLVVLDDGDTVYRWQGGAKPDADLPVNDRLDWHVIERALDRGRSRYDFVGANTAGLCEYKAKFNPTLTTYYRVERSTRSMRVVADLYRRLRDVGVASKPEFGGLASLGF
jgi:CelD/BcsL family acetyltransferase involved in cellulose biosynthesis